MKKTAQYSISLTSVFLIHALLLAGLMQQMKVPKPVSQTISPVSVSVFFYAVRNQWPAQLKIKKISELLVPVPKQSVARPTDNTIAKVASPTPPVTSENQGWGTSNWQSTSLNSSIVNSGLGMQSQLARQRAARAASITAALSAISAQLAPIISTNIVCHQDTEGQLECTPAAKENERALIGEFFKLAMEAHSLGMAENPVRITFSDTSAVSAVLQQ